MTDVAIKPYSNTLPTSATDLFTVPTGSTYIVRSIIVVNETGAAINFTMSIGNDGTGTRFLNSMSVQPAQDPFEWTGFLVLNDGEKMQGFASATGLVATIAAVQDT